MDAGSDATDSLATRYTADGRFIEHLARPPLAVTLGLEPHPEGGWYRRTWTSPVSVDVTGAEGDVHSRPTATIIVFLLPPGEFSAWHRVTSDETWIHSGLAPVTLELGGSGPRPVTTEAFLLGADAAGGQHVQVLVPAGSWQRTLPGPEASLASCVVSPGFDFADFSLDEPVRPTPHPAAGG